MLTPAVREMTPAEYAQQRQAVIASLLLAPAPKIKPTPNR